MDINKQWGKKDKQWVAYQEYKASGGKKTMIQWIVTGEPRGIHQEVWNDVYKKATVRS